MSKRASVLIALLVLAVVGEAVWIWRLELAARTAGIELRATNMGVELAADDGRVIVRPRGQARAVVAQGRLAQMLPLPPGTYDIEVVYTRASDAQSSWLREVRLDAGQRLTREVEFSSGELSVEAVVGGAAGQALVYVFNRGDHDRIITSMAASTPVLIAPGVYDLRVVLTEESEEKDMRWHEEVPIKSGLQTRVRVPFERGALLVRARNGDQALPAGAVELAVYRAGDRDRELLESGISGTPLGLAAGRYDVAVTFTASHDKPVQWLLDVAVEADGTLEQDVEFASGTVAITAKLLGGEVLAPYQTYAYFYPAGDHEQPVAYTTAPDPVVLTSGRYDVRVSFFRSHDRPDVWIRDLLVVAGKRIARAAEFASGRLLVRAFDAAGNELIGDTVFVHVHAAGERMRAIAVARSGEVMTLRAGTYDVRGEDSRRPGEQRWLQNVQVHSGRLVEQSIEYGRAAR